MDIDEKTSFEERQDNEFELLQSIYNNDITDLRKKDAWKVCAQLCNRPKPNDTSEML